MPGYQLSAGVASWAILGDPGKLFCELSGKTRISTKKGGHDMTDGNFRVTNLDPKTRRVVEFVSTLPEEKANFYLRLLDRLARDDDDSFFRQFEKDRAIVEALFHAGDIPALDRWLRRTSIRAV